MADTITIKTFAEKLNASTYFNGSAARKAVGRFQGWDDATKAKAYKLIDARFGATSSSKAAPKATPTKAPAKPAKAAKSGNVKVAAVKVTAIKVPAAKVAAKPAKAVKAPAAKATKAPAAKVSPAPKAPRGVVAPAPVCEEVNKVYMASQCIHTCAAALENAAKISERSHDPSLTQGTYTQVAAIQNKALGIIQEHYGMNTVALEKTAVAPRQRKAATPTLTSTDVPAAKPAVVEEAVEAAPSSTPTSTSI